MKIKSFMLAHKTAVNSVISSTCLIGATAGIVFGVSAGTFGIHYMDLENANIRYSAATTGGTNYYVQDIGSDWNMYAKTLPDGTQIPEILMPREKDIKTDEGRRWWLANHPTADKFLYVDKTAYGLDIPYGTEITDRNILEKRYNYTAMIIDGATHTMLDRSFNQSLYSGLVDFNHNYTVDHLDPYSSDPTKNVAHAHQPSQDNDTAFIDMYKTAAANYTMIGLAGFNHASPLQKLMTNVNPQTGDISGLAWNSNPVINKTLNESGFVLVDSNIPNNQCIASVQFRSDQPGFLAALSTCQYFLNNLNLYHDEYQPISVGLFGGVQIPSVIDYMGGYQRGIEFFNRFILSDAILDNGALFYFEPAMTPDPTDKLNKEAFETLVEHSKFKEQIEELKVSEEEPYSTYKAIYYSEMIKEYGVKIIKLGDSSTHFSGTFVAGDAIGITKQYLNRGASAIVAVAGPQSLDAAQEIANQNSRCIVIGVDTPMEDSDYQRYHNGCDERSKQEPVETDPYIDQTSAPDGTVSQQANAIIKFSAVKDMRTVTRDINFLCANGQHWNVDAHMWEHVYEPYYDDQNQTIPPEQKTTLVLSDENCIYELSDKKRVKILGIKDSVDRSRYESIIIPKDFIDSEGKERVVDEIGSGVFDFSTHTWSKLKNIRIDVSSLQDFTIDAGAFKNKDSLSIQDPHLLCIDLSDFSDSADLTIETGAFVGAWNTQDGMLCLSDTITNQDKLNIESKFINAGLSQWAQKAPSPTHSVCGTGFQTCGNIQNGLISISWDGCYPLLCALSQLKYKFNDDPLMSPMSIFYIDDQHPGAWKTVAEEYLTEHGSEITNPKYINKVKDIKNLFTFSRYVKAEGPEATYMYDNFNHTMSILGKLLQYARFTFPSDMSLVYDANGNLQKQKPTEKIPMSILEWLSTNMYFSS